MRGITKKYFSSTQRLHQIKTSPIKVVNGVLGAYSDTPNRTKEYKSMAETHNNYKDIISKLDNENISIIIATHNPNLIRHSKKNISNIHSFAMLHPAARWFSKNSQYRPAIAYIVAGNADNYIKRREQEILEDGNLSELQQRLKESSLALEVGMGYLTEWFLLLKNQFPIVANGLIESAKKINVLHFLFKITFTVDTSNLNKEMMFYNDRGITPWISFTTLEEMMPSTSKELSNALNREFNQFDKISKNAKAPFIVGLRTWLIGSNDEFDLFFKHVQQLLELPNVEHVIADWEGAQNQKLVFKIYKHLPDESKPRFGWTLRALDATNSYLNQTVDVMK